MGNEKKRLLEDADAGAGDALTVNAAFARAFEARKRKEELSRLDRRGLNESEDESTSESEDEDGEELTPELDADIRRTLRLIRKKDPAIYDPSIAFFEDKPGSDDEEEEARSKPKKDAPLYYKDLVRRQVIAGDVDSDDEEPAPVRTFKEEQDALRKEFLASVGKDDGSDDGDDDDDDGEGGLFKLRAKSANDADEDGDDDDLPTSKYGTKVKPAELDPDAFLEHYVSTEGWKDKSAAVPHYEDIVNDEEDAEELEKAENFEHAYNFRFEEDGGGEIQTHSRHIEDSMRRVDDSRKRKREERKARKALERQKKEEELRRLKNLKQAEIQAKLEKVAKLMGEKSAKNGSQSEKERLAALADDLDADFDPEEYDKRMQAIFDEEYYQEDEANAGEIEKPTWDEEEDKALFAGLPVDPDDEDETEPMEQDEDEKEEDDEVEEKEAEDDADEEEEEETEGGSDKDNEQDEEDFANMSVEEMQRAKQKYLDELYSLDYEDLIGDIKCRFKYKQVHTNNFGLTVDEIMAADDKELKQLVSLKRLAPYVEDEYEVDRKKLKRFRKSIQEALAEKEEAKQAKAKRKAEAAEKEEPVADGEEKPKKKRKRAKKSKAQESKDESVEANKGEEEEVEETKESSKTESKQDGKKKRRSKKKKGGDKAAALASTGLSTSRLESYKLLKSK